MMKQSTSFAQVATNLLNVLQGYTKTIRLLLVMFVTLSVSAEVWGAEDVSTFTSTSFTGLSSSWSRTSSGTLGYEDARGVQHQKNATTTFTATGFSNVTKVQVWVAKSKNGKGSVKIQENTTAVKTISSFNTSSTEQSYTWTTPYTGTLKIVVNATESSIYIKKIVVTTAAATTYTVTYDKNGATSGTVPTDATNYTSGTTVTVKPNSGNLAKTGHTFGGWNTNSSGTGTNYTAGSGTFNITGNTTLYAKWTAKQTNISINANTSNNGSGSGCAVIATYGQALPSFIARTPATGYELVGYYTSATGGTKVIATDGKLVASVSGYTDANAKWINESASLTLYAQYSAINYSVQYNGNSGTTSCTGGTYTYNSSFAICSDKPTRTGYSFTGWSDGTNTYQPGANYTMPAKNVTFTAQWQINTYKVKWNVDGSETEEDVNYNSKPTKAPTIDPANLPCDDADKFVGWTTGEYKGDTAPGTLYPTADDIPAITEPTTFYAVFADYAD